MTGQERPGLTQRLRPRGLRARLVWSTAGLTALAMAGTVAAVMLIVAHLTVNRVDTELRGHVDTAEASLSVDATGNLQLAPLQADDIDDDVWVFSSSGTRVSGPPAGDRANQWVETLASVRTDTFAEHHDRRYFARPVAVPNSDGATAVLVASESLKPYESTRNIALLSLLVLGFLVAVGTAALTAWTVGRTLRPVHRMTAMASDWSEHDLEARFALDDGADEFTELGDTLDALLDRVASALRGEQRLTSELAHELRTPLTTIRAEAELGQMESPSDPRYPRIIESVDLLSTTITTLLAIARDQGGGARRCDIHSVVVDLLAAAPPTAVTVDVGIEPGKVEVAVSPELAQRALAPVLENALRHATSRISIQARERERNVLISISDDGPGISMVDPESVFTPGSRHETSAGAGLGLSLARRVATAAGGRITLTSTQNPTTFEIRLPRH